MVGGHWGRSAGGGLGFGVGGEEEYHRPVELLEWGEECWVGDAHEATNEVEMGSLRLALDREFGIQDGANGRAMTCGPGA